MAEKSNAPKKRGGKRPNAGRKPKAKAAAEAQSALVQPEAQPAKKPKIGRPTDFSEKIVAEICDRLCAGESLRTICRDDHMPVCSTVFVWLTKHPAFAEQYARARDVQADAIFEEILDIADNATNDWMERRGEGDAGWVANGEHIQRSRLRVDARKWMAGKLAPKKYGEKAALELSGKDGAPLIPAINVTIGSSEPSPAS
jgi:hypothetical protein